MMTECEKWKVLFLSPFQISTDILPFHNFLPSPVDFVHVIDSTDLECSWFKRFELDHSHSHSPFLDLFSDFFSLISLDFSSLNFPLFHFQELCYDTVGITWKKGKDSLQRMREYCCWYFTMPFFLLCVDSWCVFLGPSFSLFFFISFFLPLFSAFSFIFLFLFLVSSSSSSSWCWSLGTVWMEIFLLTRKENLGKLWRRERERKREKMYEREEEKRKSFFFLYLPPSNSRFFVFL